MSYDVLKYHVVTTLPGAEARQNRMREQFKKLDPNFEDINFYYSMRTRQNKMRVTGSKCGYKCTHRYFRANTGWIGCVCGLLGALNIARMNKWPYVFVFEDDVVFDNRFQFKLDTYTKDDVYPVTLLGYCQRSAPKSGKFISPIGKIYISGGYAFLIQSSIYEILMSVLNSNDTIYVRDTFFYDDKLEGKCGIMNNGIVSIAPEGRYSNIY